MPKEIVDIILLKNILSTAYAPITTKEIAQKLGYRISNVRTNLDRMYDDDLLQKFKELNEKSVSYMLKPGKYEIIDVPYIQTKSASNLDVYVGTMDLFNLPKIAGIVPYRDNPSAGVQRVREGSWTKSLASWINKEDSIMVTSIVLYVDKTDIELDYDRNIITFNIQKYIADVEKPALIIDGQQRMWAIQILAMSKALGEEIKTPIPYIIPVTIIVGKFQNEGSKYEFLIQQFTNANNTKNLPKTLIAELNSRLKDIIDKDRFGELPNIKDASNARVARWLNLEASSPMKNIIQLTDNPLKDAFYSLNSMINVIKHFRDKLDEDESHQADIRIYEFFVDYYWAVRVSWPDQWIKPPNVLQKEGSRLLSPLGLGSLAYLIDFIAPYELRFMSDRMNRRRELTQRFLKIALAGDIDWEKDFIKRRNNKREMLDLMNNHLKVTWKSSLADYVPEDVLILALKNIPHSKIDDAKPGKTKKFLK